MPVQVVEDGHEEVFVELKGVRELNSHLPHTIHELYKDGCPLVITAVLITVTNSLDVERESLR